MKTLDRSELSSLYSFVRPERKRLIIGTIALAIGSGVSLAFPQAVRMMLDKAIQDQNKSLIDHLGIAMLILLAIQAVASAVRYFLFTWAGERIVKEIRHKLFAAFTKQEIGFFDGQMTGDLMSRLNSDATTLQNALSVNISMTLRSAAASIGGLVLLVYTSPKLTALLIAALPPAAFFAAKFGKTIRRMSKAVQDALGQASAVADEAINAMRTVRSFAAEKTEVKRFDNALLQSLDRSREKIVGVARFMGVISLFGLCAIAGVLWLGARMVLSGDMTIGTLSAYILYSLTVAISVGTLGGLWTDFMSATGAATRILTILDRTPAIDNEKGRTLASVDGNLALEHVGFSYPKRPDISVFRDLTLKIKAGEAVALVGMSGSGKSTIAALLQRFYDPLQGLVSLDGIDIRELSADWLRRQIGTVSQEPILMSTSVRENIAYGKEDASDEEIEHVAKLSFADEFIKRFPEGYNTLVGERGVQLSGGQRQRIAIARAMLKDPRILILDEATSALDAESEHLVQEALKRLMQGRTVLVIAHRLSTVRHTNRVIVLEKGEIVQEGSHDDLVKIKDGPYFNLIQKQMGEAQMLQMS